MALKYQTGLYRIVRNVHFWIVLAIFILLAILHYSFPIGGTLPYSGLGLTRHAFERILLLIPMVYSVIVFGLVGGIVAMIASLAIMLPRVINISEYRIDSFFEVVGVMVVGIVANIWIEILQKEKRRRQQSERNYRELFEKANDAIWVHDMDGDIITANEATSLMSGYKLEELLHMNVKSFLSVDSLRMAKEVRQKLLAGEIIAQPYEQKLIKKDGTEAILMLTTNFIQQEGQKETFQYIARDITEQKRMDRELRFYLQQITKAQEEERKRIARELHDDTAQSLIVLSRQLDKLISAQPSTIKDPVPFENLVEQIDSILDGVRRFSQDLRPSILDDLGLIPALQWLVSDLIEHFNISISVEVTGQERRFQLEMELLLFRIAQEALRNVWRHSGASRVWVTIEFNEKNIVLTVKDNGCGFELPDRLGDFTGIAKLGLVGMTERARLLGGELKINSEPGKGTMITVTVPM